MFHLQKTPFCSDMFILSHFPLSSFIRYMLQHLHPRLSNGDPLQFLFPPLHLLSLSPRHDIDLFFPFYPFLAVPFSHPHLLSLLSPHHLFNLFSFLGFLYRTPPRICIKILPCFPSAHLHSLWIAMTPRLRHLPSPRCAHTFFDDISYMGIEYSFFQHAICPDYLFSSRPASSGSIYNKFCRVSRRR